MWKRPSRAFFLKNFLVKFWEKSWNCQLISFILLEKYFQIFHLNFFSKINSFLLKKSYFLSKIPPYYYPGTLWVIEPGSGLGPGNGKFQKTCSGPGNPLLVFAGYPGISLPSPTLSYIWFKLIIFDIIKKKIDNSPSRLITSSIDKALSI